MKEYFYEKDNKAYIIDNEKGLIVEDLKDNIEETLIAQNNIERIMNELEDTKINKSNMEIFTKKEMKKNLIASFVALFMILGTLVVSHNAIPPFCALVSSAYVLVISIAYKEYFEHKRSINQYSAYIKELEKELEKESEKLKKMQETAKHKKVESTEIKPVPKGKVIENLNRKKYLIIDYFENRKKYIAFFEEGFLDLILKENDYKDNDIEFIKKLIEEDLNNKQTAKKKYGKKVKKY